MCAFFNYRCGIAVDLVNFTSRQMCSEFSGVYFVYVRFFSHSVYILHRFRFVMHRFRFLWINWNEMKCWKRWWSWVPTLLWRTCIKVIAELMQWVSELSENKMKHRASAKLFLERGGNPLFGRTYPFCVCIFYKWQLSLNWRDTFVDALFPEETQQFCRPLTIMKSFHLQK